MKVELPVELIDALLAICLSARTEYKVGEVLQVLQQVQSLVQSAKNQLAITNSE